MLWIPLLILQFCFYAEHLENAEEFGLQREAKACRCVLVARQAAAIGALEAAAERAEALAFSDALAQAQAVSIREHHKQALCRKGWFCV